MKTNNEITLPNHFRIKNPVNLEIRQIPVQTFVDEGGLGKMWKLFGEKTEELIEELNKELAA